MTMSMKNERKLVGKDLLRSTALAGGIAFGLSAMTTIAQAAEVTLKAKDGSSEITATLLGFDGQRYRMESTIGEILIDAFQVECFGDACPSTGGEETGFTIAGNSDILNNLIPALFEDFTTGVSGRVEFSDEGGARAARLSGTNGEQLGTVKLQGGTSKEGIANLISRDAILAVSNRPVSEVEAAGFTRSGIGNPTDPGQQVVLALDGLVMVASPGNPVNAISPANISRVFAGEITNWSQLGGRNASINLYVRESDSGTGAAFQEMVMDPQRASVSASATVLSKDADVALAVRDDPNGIGFVNFSGLNDAKPLALLGSCGIQTPATPFTLKTEEYPFTNRLLMYRPSGASPALVDRFIEYLETDDAQNVIARNSYVDQGVSLMDSDDQGRRYASAMWPTEAETSLDELGNMVQELLPAKRVSLTFRFELGSTRLESRALEDLERLSDLLAAGETFANKELLLVGFTDSIGKASNNRFLSLQRAERIREILQSIALPGSLDTTPIRTLGFGEASPLTCNDTEEGQSTNRRVEVWVRDIVKS